MIDIRDLDALTLDDLNRVASGYVSDHEYEVRHSETPELITFELRLVPLTQPYIKKYSFDEETLAVYEPLLGNELSYGAYDDGALVGLIIAEEHSWNDSVWVHEFHVAEGHRQQGVGRRLMHRLCHIAKHRGLHIVVCETQNKNAPSIAVYQKLGFHLEGVDLSYYRDSGDTKGEIAVFMKRGIE